MVPFLQQQGSQIDNKRYWWLSLGLTYRSVFIIPSVIDAVTSKTFIDVFDQSAVNFIVECILLTLVFLLHATNGKMYHQYNSIRDTPSVYIKLSKEFSLQVLP